MNMLGRTWVNSPRTQRYKRNVSRVKLPGGIGGITENSTVSVSPPLIVMFHFER
jgi:hypothetical protein